MVFSYRLLLIGTLVTLLLCFSTAQAQHPNAVMSDKRPLYLQGVLLIKLKPGLPNIRGGVDFGIPSLDNVLHTIGATKREAMFPLAPYPAVQTLGLGAPDYGFERSYIIRYSSLYDAKAAAEMIAATGTVVYSEPHYIFTLAYTPNDPKVAEQVWLDNVSAKQAWDITKGDSTIVIGICDSGVEWTHEDLKDNIYNNPGETGLDGQGRDKRSNGVDDDGNGYVDDWHGWDLVGNVSLDQLNVKQFAPDNDPAPRLNYGGNHGTEVSGCASGVADNGKGIAGMGFRCKLLPIKVASDTVKTLTMYDGYEGIRYGVDAGVNIINCSFGRVGDGGPIQALQDVIDYAYSKNVLVVAAAGNFTTNNDIIPTYPANLKHVLSVGATDANDSVASFSNYGASVHIWAPGVDIATTNYGNAYTTVPGTSFSSPITAGAAGLVKSVHPNWTPDQIAMQLRVTGDRVKVKRPEDGPLFYRRLNAYRAVTINQTFTGGNTIPGIGLVSYTINGKATDTITGANPVVDIELTLKNYLAPSGAMQITSDAGQLVKLEQPSYTIPALGSMSETTLTLRAAYDPSIPTFRSEGSATLILKITDGTYEDVIPITIPIYLPGWHKRYAASTTMSGPFARTVHAVSVDQAWAAIVADTTIAIRFSHTEDGGQSWSAYSPVSGTGGEYVGTMFALDRNTAWISGGTESGQGFIYRTVDGGVTWTKTAVNTITPYASAAHFFDANNGIIMGDSKNGKYGICTTTDGGLTWAPLATPVPAQNSTIGVYTDCYSAIGDNLWFGTNDGKIYHSPDRGNTWTTALATALNTLDIEFANANDGMALVSPKAVIGDTAINVIVTHDGGASWNRIAKPEPKAQLLCVAFIPGTTRAWVSTVGGVYETADFGVTWKPVPSPSGVLFGGMSIAANGGLVTGYGINALLGDLYNIRLGSSGVDDNASNTGSRSGGTSLLVLHPNMPNPFSATTRISFDLLRASSSAQLTVTDLTGRTLLQRNLGALPTGTHAITLDAASLPVGSYYYTIQAGTLRASSMMTVVR